jgi:uncharacterized tellurite resistance protein B-like protein
MLTMIKSLLNKVKDEPQEANGLSEKLITAALMVEVMHSDHHLDEREEAAFRRVLVDFLDLETEAASELRELAQETTAQATSLYEFTSQVNASFDYEAKLRLISNMWEIAFADGEIDRYEDGVIRRVAELTYVSHSDFIRKKLEVRDARREATDSQT